ncbi:MAG: SH3 domain-containing protein [Defluviitaleaceae bacterium]|nr:SH3 domain-containing protein [Defluviitaleaceae bacterium]
MSPERRRQRALLNNVNKKKRPNKRLGSTFKVLLSAVIAMVVIAAVLIWIGNLDLAQDMNTVRVDDGSVVRPELGGMPTMPDFVETPAIDFDAMELEQVFYWERGGNLELPVTGATGWAATNLVLRAGASTNSARVADLSAGNGFTILDAQTGWWYVRLPNGTTGWVDNRRCFINLPDVLPSIIYNNTNATASVFSSSGFFLPGVTGYQLYQARAYNPRLGREEYIVPAMYALAQALFIVQQAALSNNETIIIYEVYRPHSAQRNVATSLNLLMADNAFVRDAIVYSPWSVGNFISQGVSNHQRGAAVDASIATVNEMEIAQIGEFSYLRITSYSRMHAGSAMHELSPWSAVVDSPGGVSASAVLAGTVRWSEAVTDGVINMQRYFAAAGFRPLSSEWWHFDHVQSINIANSVGISGNFYTETIYSILP